MHDLVVVSDLHLGRGKNPNTGRYFELEAFFYDEDFRHFGHWLVDDAHKRNASLRLIINGDASSQCHDAAAVGLYRGLGLREAYRYWYRTR